MGYPGSGQQDPRQPYGSALANPAQDPIVTICPKESARAYNYAAEPSLPGGHLQPRRFHGWAAIDAPIPGIGHWDSIILTPLLWHFNFRGPDVERLVRGRERIYLDRFYNDFAADPKRIDEQTREHYAGLYAKPHAMHDAFEQFGAFGQDAIDNRALLASCGKISMPVLAVGGEKSFGSAMADELRFVADNVTTAIVPASGHWIMEENPRATIQLIIGFIG